MTCSWGMLLPLHYVADYKDATLIELELTEILKRCKTFYTAITADYDAEILFNRRMFPWSFLVDKNKNSAEFPKTLCKSKIHYFRLHIS